MTDNDTIFIKMMSNSGSTSDGSTSHQCQENVEYCMLVADNNDEGKSSMTFHQKHMLDVENFMDNNTAEWTAPFLFEVAPWKKSKDECTTTADVQTITDNLGLYDICSFLGGQQPAFTRLYFSPEKCPTSTTIGKENTLGVFQTLKKDLESAAFKVHFQLFSNGGSGKARTRRFKCGACINRVNSKRHLLMKDKKRIQEFRSSILVNDRKKARGRDGQSMPRRTNTNIADKSCTFSFTVRWDDVAFFISLEKKSGCNVHRFHHKLNCSSLPTRLLADDERQTLEHLAASCCTTGVGRRVRK